MNSFKDLGLSGPLLDGIRDLGFEHPTPIQEKVIPVLLEKWTDLVGLAQTGTGKTAAFGLPLLQTLDTHAKGVQALVLAPTRELAIQITHDLERFSSALSIRIVAVYGGASISDQIKRIKQGAQLVVATPGRLQDLITRRVIHLESTRLVVLDEADEMLNMGFKEDIDEILSCTPASKNVWLFSATMPREVREIAKNYMSHPVEITLGDRNQGNENIDHQYVVVDARDKYTALKRLVDYHPDMFGVVFCRTKIDTQRLAEHLIKDGHNADALHGDLSQAQRDKVMRSFRNRHLQLLICTDVAARGIDVSNISHVIHMNLPDEMEFYTHRSGRTARAGKKGISLVIAERKEVGKIRQIEKKLNRRFTKVSVPTGEEIGQVKLMDLMHQLRSVKVNDADMDHYLPEVFHELSGLSKEEIIKRFAALEFNRFFELYRDAPDLNRNETQSAETHMSDRYAVGDRIFINVGKMDGLDRRGLLDLICEFGEVTKKQVGRIDLKGAYSFFEMEKSHTPQLLEGFEGVKVKGRQVRLEISGPKTEKKKGGRRQSSRPGKTKRVKATY